LKAQDDVLLGHAGFDQARGDATFGHVVLNPDLAALQTNVNPQCGGRDDCWPSRCLGADRAPFIVGDVHLVDSRSGLQVEQSLVFSHRLENDLPMSV
jgi:hypothetical protein